jgi:hypothetical protein
MTKKLISIGEASKTIGVSIDTLRQWEKKGVLKPFRPYPTSKRYYLVNEINEFLKTPTEPSEQNLIELAKNWLSKTPSPPPTSFYCKTSDIFNARLQSLETKLLKNPQLKKLTPLIIAITGEIGNNSYNHNIGSWPDTPGIFFGSNSDKNYIVLADRGQGILKSLKRVKPGLKNDKEALNTAFTEYISGRAPENRGNGLKFVKDIIQTNPFSLEFYTGNAQLKLKEGDKTLKIKETSIIYKGCLAIIKY